MRTVPNMAIFDVGDATDIEGVLDLVYEWNGPAYIRMLRKEVPRLFPANEPMVFNRARTITEGDDVLIHFIINLYRRSYACYSCFWKTRVYQFSICMFQH